MVFLPRTFFTISPSRLKMSRIVDVTTDILPHCGPVKYSRDGSGGLSLLWDTGIPSAGPFLIKRGQMLE